MEPQPPSGGASSRAQNSPRKVQAVIINPQSGSAGSASSYDGDQLDRWTVGPYNTPSVNVASDDGRVDDQNGGDNVGGGDGGGGGGGGGGTNDCVGNGGGGAEVCDGDDGNNSGAMSSIPVGGTDARTAEALTTLIDTAAASTAANLSGGGVAATAIANSTDATDATGNDTANATESVAVTLVVSICSGLNGEPLPEAWLTVFPPRPEPATPAPASTPAPAATPAQTPASAPSPSGGALASAPDANHPGDQFRKTGNGQEGASGGGGGGGGGEGESKAQVPIKLEMERAVDDAERALGWTVVPTLRGK